MSFENNFEFSNKYNDFVEKYLFSVFNSKEYPCTIKNYISNYRDKKENTDFEINYNGKKTNLNVACRIRRNYVINKFSTCITFRIKCQVENVEVEWDKFLNSYGDIMFYGIENKEENNIITGKVVDLKILRRMLFEYKSNKGSHLGDVIDNKDGTMFREIDLKYLPSNINNKPLIISYFGEEPILNKLSFDNWILKLKNNLTNKFSNLGM